MCKNCTGAGRFRQNSDAGRIPAEEMDIFLDPIESEALIEQP